MAENAERTRLAEHQAGTKDWKRWGPYVSERAWGTVREDYSANGDAWGYFPHEHARSRAYRWSEDGIGGFCDTKQHLCLAVALWNEQDAILKERMFGLSNPQGNHGEDVKEYYFFLDGTPTHSYMKMLYKYPQVAYPYEQLVEVNGRLGQDKPEYELFDALRDAFTSNRYFDVFIEYAKGSAEDLLCQIRIVNRGPEPAPIHVLPHLWFRNTWSWSKAGKRHTIRAIGPQAASTSHPKIGQRWWYFRADGNAPGELLFTENETNFERVDGVKSNSGPFVKDGIHDAVIVGNRSAVNDKQGSKLAGHAHAVVPPGGTFTVQVRFSDAPLDQPFADFDRVLSARADEANAFYDSVYPPKLKDDERRVVRQAYAGLLWSKQFYHYDVFRWLTGDETQPTPPPERWHGRNRCWKELHNADVILMPDTWEYPWYASWDLSFHCVALARVDAAFAKQQLLNMGYEWYQHANGQYPAYEWDFDDINPPVTAWAAWRIYQIEQETGGGDLEFLKQVFQSELLNYNFWVNRRDRGGRDIFGGGFLGMDNIGCFDRDQPLPEGGQLEQSDGTSWMAFYSVSMLAIAIELAHHDPFYQNAAIKFFEHFLYIAHAMTNLDGVGIDLWDAEDQFFYDAILPNEGQTIPLKIHSMVGLVPLFAASAVAASRSEGLSIFADRSNWFLNHRPDLLRNVAPVNVPSASGTKLLSILTTDRLVAVLRRMLDSDGFLSDYGVRALSRYHLKHPYTFEAGGQKFVVKYLPAESDNRLFGGNSNWRGPIWFPVNYMIVRSLHHYFQFYGDTLKVECPTGSGQLRNLDEVAAEIARRMAQLFLRDTKGQRAVWGANPYFQTDPHWRDYIPFHEYFHGDTGAGLGASHQTGWTALIVSLLHEYGGQ